MSLRTGSPNSFLGYNKNEQIIDICFRRSGGKYQKIYDIDNILSINKNTDYYMPYSEQYDGFDVKYDISPEVIVVINHDYYFGLDLKTLKIVIKSILYDIDCWFDFNNQYYNTKEKRDSDGKQIELNTTYVDILVSISKFDKFNLNIDMTYSKKEETVIMDDKFNTDKKKIGDFKLPSISINIDDNVRKYLKDVLKTIDLR